MSQLLQDVLSGDRRRHPLHPLQDPQREQQRREVLVLLQEPEVPGGVLEARPRAGASLCANKVLGVFWAHPDHHSGEDIDFYLWIDLMAEHIKRSRIQSLDSDFTYCETGDACDVIMTY